VSIAEQRLACEHAERIPVVVGYVDEGEESDEKKSKRKEYLLEARRGLGSACRRWCGVVRFSLGVVSVGIFNIVR
jgi:hypothetical protein